MNKNDFMEETKMELEKRGYVVEAVMFEENGLNYAGFKIVTDGTATPTLCREPQETIDEFVERIEEALANKPEFDMTLLHDKGYVAKNLRIAVQRVSSKDIVKKPLLNVEAYMFVICETTDGTRGFFKVTEELLNLSGMSKEDAWKHAEKNTYPKFQIISLARIIEYDIEEEKFPFYVVVNEDGNGASALMFPEIFRNFCTLMEVGGVLIMPSNTHEIMIAPDSDDKSVYEWVMNLMDTVNEETVAEFLLDTVVYRYDMKTDEIKIVAEYTKSGITLTTEMPEGN